MVGSSLLFSSVRGLLEGYGHHLEGHNGVFMGGFCICSSVGLATSY